MALTLADRIAGPEVAQAIQLGIEYDPQPPFDAGSPREGSAEIVEMLRSREPLPRSRRRPVAAPSAAAPGAGSRPITCDPDGRASLRPAGDRAALAGALGRRAHVGGGEPRGRASLADGRAHERAGQLLRARDAPLPERRAAHRASEVLLGRRRDRPLPPPLGQPRAAPDGLRRVRAARREPRDQDRRAPARLDRRVDRRPSSASSAPGGSRSTGRASSPPHEPELLPLDAVDLPRAVPGRASPTARRPPSSGAPNDQTVLANEQVDAEGRCERCGRLVEVRQLEQWFLRITDYAERLLERPRHDRLARARQDDAAQLDRAQRGRRGDVPLRGARRRLPRLHDAARHAVRRDVLRDGARAPRRAAPRRGDRARAGGARLRQPRAQRDQRGTRQRREGRRPACRSGAPSPTPSTASRSRCTSPTTC